MVRVSVWTQTLLNGRQAFKSCASYHCFYNQSHFSFFFFFLFILNCRYVYTLLCSWLYLSICNKFRTSVRMVLLATCKTRSLSTCWLFFVSVCHKIHSKVITDNRCRNHITYNYYNQIIIHQCKCLNFKLEGWFIWGEYRRYEDH